MWTEARVERLKSLHADGYSCAMIASKIGGVTRNAVIGKLSRIGLTGTRVRRKSSVAASPPPKRSRLRVYLRQRPTRRSLALADAAIEALGEVIDLPADVSPDQVSIIEARAGQCRYPLWGSVTPPDPMVCGAPTVTDSCSWCARHLQIVRARS